MLRLIDSESSQWSYSNRSNMCLRERWYRISGIAISVTKWPSASRQMWWPSFQDVRSFKSFCQIKLSKLSFRFDNSDFGQWVFLKRQVWTRRRLHWKLKKNVEQRLKGLETFSLCAKGPAQNLNFCHIMLTQYRGRPTLGHLRRLGVFWISGKLPKQFQMLPVLIKSHL